MPIAVSAAVYPPALLVLLLLLTGAHPRGLVLAYYSGAAILTITAGLIVFAALKATGVNDQSSTTASGTFDIVLGALLLALAPGRGDATRATPSRHRRTLVPPAGESRGGRGGLRPARSGRLSSALRCSSHRRSKSWR